MSVKCFISVVAIAAANGLAASAASGQITIPTVPIGNPGNAADPTTGDVYGAVAYTYNIGQTEVTNAQYAAFLNAVAASDPFDLYDPSMGGDRFGGIGRSGWEGSYTYWTHSERGNNPVNYVSFLDAARFANWLHNGQGSGDTESGAYTLNPGGTITRNAGWHWAVTSYDEWYKAAYHQPASEGGDADDYWMYPTRSNTATTTAQANIHNFPFSDGIDGTVPVRSYSPNFYGTFDMGGNAAEWNEAILTGHVLRSVRGGSFLDNHSGLRADAVDHLFVYTEARNVGFRVSQKIQLCPADFNGDNSVDFFDYLDFVSAFDAEAPNADFNGDNSVDFFDYLDFVAAFDADC